MSKFNNYAKKLNEIANATFTEYRAKSDAVKSAESKYNAYPWRDGADPTYLAKSARARADLAEAKAQFEHCRRHLFEEQRKDIAVIRAELVEALGKEYAADPKAVDANTLALMNSGIMTADEYSRLIDSAMASGNFTMTRLLAKSADDMAEKVTDSDVARSYRLVSHKGKGMDGREYLQAFDFLADTFNRCERNFALTGKWDELTSPVVDSF